MMSARAAPDASPILATKLYRPPMTADVQSRPHLLDRLDCNIYRPLTLISAPAGYGKTTLAGMWLQSCGCPSAWVSLDEGDNDLRTFTAYLVAAIQGVFPASELKTGALLEVPSLPPVTTLAHYLLNDLDRIEKPFILALDDLHLIREQRVYDLLAELLRHPARSMRLLLIGRRDPALPIASLRARGQVTEIRARDLRFEPSETAQLLSRMLGRPVDATTADDWTRRTEGWAAALQLAALALRHREQHDDLRAGIQEGSRYLEDYLVSEVIARLPPARRACLLKLAIVDRFTPPLCEALCRDAADNDAAKLDGQEFIGWLRDENLFLVSLDDRQTWFRFHHLFQGLLQKSLQAQSEPGELAGLHRQASTWFEENGLWDEALRHLLAANDTAAAVDLVVRHRYELMNTQQWQRLRHWLRLFPADAANQDPYLLAIKAHLAVHAQSWQASDLIAILQHAEQARAALPPESDPSRVLQAEMRANLCLIDIAMGEPARAFANAQQCLQALPDEAALLRMLANVMRAIGLQMQGEYESSLKYLDRALSGPGLPSELRAFALQLYSIVSFLDADLDTMITLGRDSLRMAAELERPWTVGYARHFLGVSHYLRNEFAQAELHLSALLQDWATVPPSYLVFGAFAMALIHMARREWSDAESVLEMVETHLDRMSDAFAIATAGACRVELALRKGDLGAAQRMSAGVQFDVRPPMWWFFLPQLTPIKLALVEGTPQGLARARADLESLDERMAAIYRKSARTDVLALLALVRDAQGDSSSATEALAEALVLAEPGGFIRTFVDLGPPMADLLTRMQRDDEKTRGISPSYISRILAAFPAAGRPAKSPHAPSSLLSGESLTEREMEVLRLLVTELSPREIAQQLSITIATARTHSKNIYGKLAVHSRFEAVHRARELGLL